MVSAADLSKHIGKLENRDVSVIAEKQGMASTTYARTFLDSAGKDPAYDLRKLSGLWKHLLAECAAQSPQLSVELPRWARYSRRMQHDTAHPHFAYSPAADLSQDRWTLGSAARP